MFFEFSPEIDQYSIFNTETSLTEFEEARKTNESAEILPSVLLALKAGRKKERTEAPASGRSVEKAIYHGSVEKWPGCLRQKDGC